MAAKEDAEEERQRQEVVELPQQEVGQLPAASMQRAAAPEAEVMDSVESERAEEAEGAAQLEEAAALAFDCKNANGTLHREAALDELDRDALARPRAKA